MTDDTKKAAEGERKWANDPTIKHIDDVCECSHCARMRIMRLERRLSDPTVGQGEDESDASPDS